MVSTILFPKPSKSFSVLVKLSNLRALQSISGVIQWLWSHGNWSQWKWSHSAETGVSFDPSTTLLALGKMYICITDILAHSSWELSSSFLHLLSQEFKAFCRHNTSVHVLLAGASETLAFPCCWLSPSVAFATEHFYHDLAYPIWEPEIWCSSIFTIISRKGWWWEQTGKMMVQHHL